MQRKLKGAGKDLIRSELEKIYRYSQYYQYLLNPEGEEVDLNEYMQDLNKVFEANASYPFLLKVYGFFKENSISKEELIEMLGILESYYVRHAFSQYSDKNFNKFFAGVCGQIEKENVVKSLRESLMKVPDYRSTYWPNDIDFIKGIKENWPAKAVCKFVLIKIEQSFNHAEALSKDSLYGMTIEQYFHRPMKLRRIGRII